MNNGGFLSTQSVRENQLANLSKQIDDLKNQLQKKENIIKEVREYIYNKEINTLHFNSKDFLDTSIATELLEILDKEVN